VVDNVKWKLTNKYTKPKGIWKGKKIAEENTAWGHHMASCFRSYYQFIFLFGWEICQLWKMTRCSSFHCQWSRCPTTSWDHLRPNYFIIVLKDAWIYTEDLIAADWIPCRLQLFLTARGYDYRDISVCHLTWEAWLSYCYVFSLIRRSLVPLYFNKACKTNSAIVF